MDLIREYADHHSESAFAELVRRHINLVYSIALRFTGNSADAQDVVQAVFVILAEKAASLRQRATPTGWLYETTRLTARQLLRTKARQQARDQEAYMRSTLNDAETDGVWQQLAPILEEAMSCLNEKERMVLALCFYENRSGAETAALLGIREWAAHKRTMRAVEKLRGFFTKRGVVVPAAVLTAAISANAVQAAPIGLAASVTITAVKGTAVAASTLTFIRTTLKIMAWNKLKTASVVGVALLFGAGAIMVTTRERSRLNSAVGTGISTTSVLTNLDRTTPKGTLRYLAVMLDSGDAHKVAEAVQLDAGTNPQAEDAVVNLVSGQFEFKRSMVAKFGEGNVNEALQRWSLLKVPTDGLDEAEERIDGDSSVVQLPGRSPLRFVKVAGNWRLALSTGNTTKAIAQFNLAGKLMLDAVSELSAGKYASPEEVFKVLQSRMMAAR